MSFLQVVDFMGSLLQRACVGLDPGRGPGSGNPVESDTLSMGVGLLATLLSGPQVLKPRAPCVHCVVMAIGYQILQVHLIIIMH